MPFPPFQPYQPSGEAMLHAAYARIKAQADPWSGPYAQDDLGALADDAAVPPYAGGRVVSLPSHRTSKERVA